MSDQDIERRIARDIAKWQRGVRDKGEPLQIDEGWLHTRRVAVAVQRAEECRRAAARWNCWPGAPPCVSSSRPAAMRSSASA